MKQLEQIEIGRYQIQSHLVRGGMADIYLAYDKESDRTVAIKMVHESAGDYCERFQREVKAMAGLAHEHILPAFDYGEYESWYFLVTPYIEYGTLNGRLSAGPLTLEEVDPILAQLADALQFAHEQGVIHRDVKPSNILMRNGNHVYLADFGLVKRVGQEHGLTVTGYLIGTPEYMAPELAEEDATPQSDVYALGVLLYQMLAGRVPFTASTPMGVFLRHIRDLPQPPTAYNPSIPSEVENVILHAIEKDPQRRYQSARELYQAYQEAVKDAAVSREAGVEQPDQIQVNQRPGTVDIRIIKQRGRMRRPVLIMALLAFFLFVGVFALVSAVLSPGMQGSNVHTADAQGAKNTATPATRHVGSGSPMDSAASNRPVTGSTSVNTIDPISTAVLDQGSGSSIQTQGVKDVGASASDGSGTGNGSAQSGDNGGGSGQGTTQGSTNTAGNGGTASGTGSSSTPGQSSGSGGNGNGSGPGNSGSGQGAGSGGNQGNGGSGQGAGSGNNGNGQGNGGSGQGAGNGQGNGGNGQGAGNGNNGNGNGGSGQGNGGNNGPGNGNGNGGNGQGAGNGNNGNGNGNGGDNGKGHGNGNGGGKGRGNSNGGGKGNGKKK